MSIFNPQVQPGRDDMPSYLKQSSPISDLTADKSTGLSLAGLGTGIEGGAELLEKTAKDVINKDVRSKLEPIRDEFTRTLEGDRDAQTSVVPAPVQTAEGSTAGGKTLVLQADSNAPPPPPQVLNGIDKVQSIQDAMTHGKVNDTYYTQRLKEAVTSLRSNYPGFADYIDQRVSAITGINPANAYVNNLMQDINRAQVNKKSEEDKILDIARTKGIMFDKGYSMYQRLQADPSFAPTYMKWYNEENVKDTQIAREKSDLELKKSKGQASEKDGQGVLSSYISSKIDSDLNGTITVSGLDKPTSYTDFMKKAEENPNSFSAQQYEEFATKLQTHVGVLRSQLVLLTNQKGYTKDAGGTNIRDAELDSQLKLYDGFINAARGGGAGGFSLAFFQMNQARAMKDKSLYNLTSGKTGEYMNNFQIMSEKYGPIITAKILVPQMIESLNQNPEQIKPLLMEKGVEARAQPGGADNPTTLAKHLADGVNNQHMDKVNRAYYQKGLVNTVKDLTNPDISEEGKAAVAQYLFTPGNNGVLQNWKMDYKTTSPDGRMQIMHPGKYDVWTQLTDKKVTNSISKLDETNKNNYVNWVNITGRELIGEDVRNLKHFTGHDNLSFEWVRPTNDSPPKLVLKDQESPVGKIARPSDAGMGHAIPQSYLFQVQAVVDRINRAIPNLDHVYKSMGGGDTETMILQTLQQYGMDFEGKITGLPKAFGDAVAGSRPAKTKVKE